jgi:iron complex outermembrane recepter protein
MRHLLLSSATAAVLSFALSTSAFAQTTPNPDVEVVIVTAQKREENLQKVPAAVSVLSAATLANANAVNIEGVTALIPSLTFNKGGTTLNSSLFLRGVGTINFSIAAEPSVAFVLDGVVMARAGEAFGDLYDLQRMEVLRGPQGTLSFPRKLATFLRLRASCLLSLAKSIKLNWRWTCNWANARAHA